MGCTQVTVGDSEAMVTPGMSLSINDIAAEPKVTITDCKPNGIYAFLLVRCATAGAAAAAAVLEGMLSCGAECRHCTDEVNLETAWCACSVRLAGTAKQHMPCLQLANLAGSCRSSAAASCCTITRASLQPRSRL